MADSDLTFITNEPGRNLLDRFKVLIKDTKLFDALVGYFYTSGFHALYKSLESTFGNPKIIFRQTGDRIIAAIDKNVSYYCIDSVNVAQVKSKYHEYMDFFVGLLNSQLMIFYYQEISQEKGRVLAQVKPQRIRLLPINMGTPQQRKPIIDLVNRITELKLVDPKAETSVMEKQIDRMIYDLYGLTADEIVLVENSDESL